MLRRAGAIFTLFIIVFTALHGQCSGQGKGGGNGNGNGNGKGRLGGAVPLKIGFYTGKCGTTDVEVAINGVVSQFFFNDSSIAPALTRMQFHDCFVHGCDASILLDGNNTEKTAFANLNVRGYEMIDAAKATLEAICPGVVSCADIIALATRDAIFLTGGARYIVRTGRRDGKVSLASNVNLPGTAISVNSSISMFASKGLNTTDMVLLLGAHTIGVAHCSFFTDRLIAFNGTGESDPTMDPSLLKLLRSRCLRDLTVDSIVNLDQKFLSASSIDNSYYQQIVANRGVLQIDQALALDPLTKDIVGSIATKVPDDFAVRFGEAMIKLGRVGVITGKKRGEIRRSCRSIN